MNSENSREFPSSAVHEQRVEVKVSLLYFYWIEHGQLTIGNGNMVATESKCKSFMWHKSWKAQVDATIDHANVRSRSTHSHFAFHVWFN